jgi:hypothetical protein
MSKVEFTELEEQERAIDQDFRDWLMAEENAMPAAIVCIRERSTQKIFGVVSKLGRVAGLPIIDLAAMKPKEHIASYVGFRLWGQYRLRVKARQLRLEPFESNVSPYMESIANKDYPDIHHRWFVPVIGETANKPTSELLRPLDADEIIGSIASPEAGEALRQLIDIHREVIREFPPVLIVEDPNNRPPSS